MKKNTEPLQPDTIYHIYNRGNNRENIFFEERNFHYFLEKYAQYIEPVAQTFAYALLGNHFHLAILTKSEDDLKDFYKAKYPAKEMIPPFSKIISQQFANLFNTYTQAINKAYGRTGGLFEEPFRRKAIENQLYFSSLIHYIHFNPQAHGFTADFRDYAHSSYQSYISNAKSKLQRDEVIGWFGNVDEFKKFHIGTVDKNYLEWFDIE